MLVVDLEPTPYKFDQWNSCAGAGIKLSVVFSKRRQQGRAAGHNYEEFPHASFPYFAPSTNQLMQGLRAFWVFLRKVVSDKTNVVFVMGYSTFFTFSAIAISKSLGKKVIIHTDSLDQRELSDWGVKPHKVLVALSNLRKTIIYKLGDSFAVADQVLSTSANTSPTHEKLVFPFPYTISFERFAESAEGAGASVNQAYSRPRLLFSGRLIPRKGLETLLIAFSKLQDKDLHLTVEGDGPMLESSKALARELEIAERVLFTGFQQMGTHSKLVLNADIVCVPSLYDSWGLAVVEGMATGRVVVASDRVGSARSLIAHGSNGFLFRAGNPEELKKGLEEALSCSEGRMRKIGLMASMTANAISPATNAERLIKSEQQLSI